MNVFFLFDEYSDQGEEVSVQKLSDVTMDAVKNPHKPRPASEIVYGEVVRQ